MIKRGVACARLTAAQVPRPQVPLGVAWLCTATYSYTPFCAVVYISALLERCAATSDALS